MSFPPPPSKVHFIHNHPSDQTEPNPLGRIEHSRMLDNLSGILCCKSTSTLRNWTCYSLLVLERWTILYLNSSVPSSSSSAYHSKRSCRLYFILFYFLKNCIYCFLLLVFPYSFLKWSRNCSERKWPPHKPWNMRKVLYLLFSSCCRPLHEKTLQH